MKRAPDKLLEARVGLDGANDERTRFVAGLEIPPVDSAKKAVQVQIVKDAKGAK